MKNKVTLALITKITKNLNISETKIIIIINYLLNILMCCRKKTKIIIIN